MKLRRCQYNAPKIKVILMVVWTLLTINNVSAGKSKSKAGKLAASQMYRGESGKNTATPSDINGKSKETNQGNRTSSIWARSLKYTLIDGYDSALRPVEDHRKTVNIKVGFTFRQVLDLDEKNQVLKSLVWFRMEWKDEFLSWHPEEFGGIQEIEIPYSSIWRPDIVVYEETGARDYNPRLQNAKVNHDGTVKYNEPITYETTCSIDTSFFPFDKQVCYLTFISWTEAVSKIDLSSDRDPKKFFEDTKNYFVSTGEWQLVGMNVRKIVQDYGQLFSTKMANHTEEMEKIQEESLKNANGRRKCVLKIKQYHRFEPEGKATQDTYYNKKFWFYNFERELMANPSNLLPEKDKKDQTPSGLKALHDHHEREHKKLHKTKFPMLPQALTTYETLGNTSIRSDMFAEIKFVIVLRRNSSLYMQSMLFPSILLTAVAILGFYLPPDSGERIGLQITILLTFMVFLLAVGEMFPASTGPYLGVYFVLCMGLLGINLTMTVGVLHLHFKPVIVRDPELERRFKKRRMMLSKARQRRFVGCCMDPMDEEEQLSDGMLKKAQKLETSVVPKRLRQFLQFCNHYWSLKEYNARWLYDVTDDEKIKVDTSEGNSEDDASSDEDNESSFSSYYGRRDTMGSGSGSFVTESEIAGEKLPSNCEQFPTKITDNYLDVPSTAPKRSKSFSDSVIPTLRVEEQKEAMCSKPSDTERPPSPDQPLNLIGLNALTHDGLGNMKKQRASTERRGSFLKQSFSAMAALNLARHRSKNEDGLKRKQNSGGGDAGENVSVLRYKVMGAINDLKGYIKKNEKINRRKKKSKKEKRKKLKQKLKEQEQERQDMEQEEWKSVARALDILCFRIYIIIIIASHASLFIIAADTWLSDDSFSDLDYTV